MTRKAKYYILFLVLILCLALLYIRKTSSHKCVDCLNEILSYKTAELNSAIGDGYLTDHFRDSLLVEMKFGDLLNGYLLLGKENKAEMVWYDSFPTSVPYYRMKINNQEIIAVSVLNKYGTKLNFEFIEDENSNNCKLYSISW